MPQNILRRLSKGKGLGGSIADPDGDVVHEWSLAQSNPTHKLESRSPDKGASPRAAYFQNSMTGRHVVLLVDVGVGGHDLLQPQNDLMAMPVS